MKKSSTIDREVASAPEVIERTLELAGIGMILIGGQALAFWSSYYDLSIPAIAITKDIDLLGTREDVERLAKGLAAEASFPSRKNSLTSLVGQVRKDVGAHQYINIDVLKDVYGAGVRRNIDQRAVTAANRFGPFRVLHPIDVLQGRLDNTYKLTEKQDEHGLAQLRLSVEVTRAFLNDIAAHPVATAGASSRPIVLRHIGRIEEMALSDAGRKVAKRYGIHVVDAIDPKPVAHLKTFMAKKFPQLLKLMSAQRRAQFS